jgi:lipopolysaccharide/colanic/teichoic acid biosynthesis glycosyltransferase
MKRTFDLLCTLSGVLLLSPLFLLVACAVKLDSPGPVFFRQQRVGRHGRLFRIWKFRTMAVAQDGNAPRITTEGDRRITRFGQYLRRYKLDELPQLFNVAAGDMSLVGPRPEVPEYVALYPAELREIVLSVRPGITDLASIEFSDEQSRLAGAADPHECYVKEILPKKLTLYRQYVEDWSLLLDLKLIVRTLVKLVKPD